MCTPRGNVDQAFLVTSHDAGAVFGPHLPAPSGTRLVAGSATALALGGRGGVNVSHDGGVTWHETLQGTGGPTFLGFEDATTARASFGNGTLYTTTDAGDTWSTSSPAG